MGGDARELCGGSPGGLIKIEVTGNKSLCCNIRDRSNSHAERTTDREDGTGDAD
jgi:hypothetical protein